MTAADVIRTQGLTKRFGDVTALDHLDLEVQAATVFGFLGPNGAGKSTTIRLLVGLTRPTSGTASVLGLDTVTARDEVHRRIGYLPGDFFADRNLTADEYLRYVANLRGGVDPTAVAHLAERFGLHLNRRIGTLSHGNRQKVGIIQACMHQPDLLVLDEPTSGLDPLVQREFHALVREFRDAGRTVFLSSHDLTEVQAVADTVAIIRDGRLVVTSDVADLALATRHHMEITFASGVDAPTAALEALSGVHDIVVTGDVVQVTVDGSMVELLRLVAPLGVERIVSNAVDLEDVFLQYFDQDR